MHKDHGSPGLLMDAHPSLEKMFRKVNSVKCYVSRPFSEFWDVAFAALKEVKFGSNKKKILSRANQRLCTLHIV